jgi:hypothetical protein
MNGNDEFWLHLTRMADAYSDGGLTHAERAACALEHFQQMPYVAQREVLESLRSAAYQLPDLYTIVAAKLNAPPRVAVIDEQVKAG